MGTFGPVLGTSDNEKGRRLFVSFHQQWSGLNPFGEYNWRDFSLVHLGWEWVAYSGRWEVEIALLGFWLTITWIFDDSFNRDLKEQAAAAVAELEGKP